MSFSVRSLEQKPKKRLRLIKLTKLTLSLGRPILGYYSKWKQRYNKGKERDRRVLLLKRILFVLVAILACFFLISALARTLISVKHLGIKGTLSIAGATLPRDEHDYLNVLLLGQGDADHDGINLIDTFIVASFDPDSTQSTVMLSLPRDLYFLSTEKMGKGKLNSLYRDYRSYLRFQKGMEEDEASAEALTELKDEIGRALGLEIHHAIKVDFQGFIEGVDLIGGIEIDVPSRIVDNKFPDNNYGYEPFVIEAGLQTLDGETALKYARSRSTTSDFDRSARQQQIISALAEKIRNEKLYAKAQLISEGLKILKSHLESTMTIREMIGIAELGLDLDREKIRTMQLSDRNALYDSFIEPGGFLYTPPRNLFEGASVLLPVSIPEFPVTWKQIRTLTTLLMIERTPYLDSPTFSILNAGAPSGVARRLGTELTRYGFQVDLIENADLGYKLDTSSLIGDEGSGQHIDFWSKLLDINQNPAPTELTASKKREITLLLGTDFRYTPLQNLVTDS